MDDYLFGTDIIGAAEATPHDRFLMECVRETILGGATMNIPDAEQVAIMAKVRPMTRATAEVYLKAAKASLDLAVLLRRSGSASADISDIEALQSPVNLLLKGLPAAPEPLLEDQAQAIGSLLERSAALARRDQAVVEAKGQAVAEVPSDIGKALGRAAGSLATGAGEGLVASLPWWLWALGAGALGIVGYGLYRRVRG